MGIQLGPNFANLITGFLVLIAYPHPAQMAPQSPTRPHAGWEPDGAPYVSRVVVPDVAYRISKEGSRIGRRLTGRHSHRSLLQFDGRSLLFEFRLDGLGLVLRHGLFHGRRR